jgi:peptidoglycan/LPS O-acetylase OafA/YrhL
LDGLRAIAISLVVLHHCDVRERMFSGTLFERILHLGGIGVQSFFVLSGYFVTSLMVREVEQKGAIQLRSFYWRRWARLVPPMYFFLCVLGVLWWGGMIELGGHRLHPSFFFFANLKYQPTVVAHFWSLGVQEQLYLLWPLLFLVCGNHKTRILLVTAAIAVAPVWRHCAVHFAESGAQINWTRTDLKYDGVAIGCLLALLSKTKWGERILSSRWLTGDLPILVFVALILVCFSDAVRQIPRLGGLIPTFSVFCIAGIINSVVRAPRAKINRILQLGLLVWLGRLSYSLFLWQQLFTIDHPNAPWLSPRFPLNLVPILGMACLSYYGIERPLQRFRVKPARPETSAAQNHGELNSEQHSRLPTAPSPGKSTLPASVISL